MREQTYDITPVMCDIFDKMVDEFANARDDKGELINDPEQLLWESKVFLKHSIEKIFRVMRNRHPYDANSKTALSTDVSDRTISRIVNKK